MRTCAVLAVLIVMPAIIVACTGIKKNEAGLHELSIDGITYTDMNDGTIFVKPGNLYWMKCSQGQTWNRKTNSCDGVPGKFNYRNDEDVFNYNRVNPQKSEAWKTCLSLNSGDGFAGRKSWQLPAIEELRSLLYCDSGKPAYHLYSHEDHRRCEGKFSRPAIAHYFFPKTANVGGWANGYASRSECDDSSNITGLCLADFHSGQVQAGSQRGDYFVRCISR